MKYPTRTEVRRYLDEAGQLNPGPWIQHSLLVAQAARAIARRCPGMDGDVAYAMGALHDIGRRAGVTDVRHVLDGYDFLMAEGFPAQARICLTHCFPVKSVKTAAGKWDCTGRELRFVAAYLKRIRYTKYDKLIQLCDAISMSNGYCLMEKRLIDVALRRGFSLHSPRKWREFLAIQRLFESLIGCSIYKLLPGVVENTFGFERPRQ